MVQNASRETREEHTAQDTRMQTVKSGTVVAADYTPDVFDEIVEMDDEVTPSRPPGPTEAELLELKTKREQILHQIAGLHERSLEDPSTLGRLRELMPLVHATNFERFIQEVAAKTNMEKKDVLHVLSGDKEPKFKEVTKPLDRICQVIKGFPYKSLVMPVGYSLEVNVDTGLPEIWTVSGKKEVLVTRVAAFPIRAYIPKNKATLDHPELYQMVRYNPISRNWEEVPQVFKKSYLCYSAEIIRLANTGLSVGSSNSAELAKFFQTFLDVNAQNVELVLTVDKFGWSVDKLTGQRTFAPFFGTYAVIPASGDISEKEDSANDFEKVKAVMGSREEALAIIGEQSDNLVFQTMLAGVLAGPLIHLIRDHLQEGIGIDLSGKTSKGKTSIQKIAYSLIIGDANPFVRSWEGATSNGLWGVANKANHLPFILDDSHHISAKLANMPHALINGIQGDKLMVAHATNALDLRENKTVMTVILFNGEVKLAEQTLIANSRGLLGRVIMVEAEPFPDSYTSEQVRGLVRRAHANRGQFRDEWFNHLSQLDTDKTTNEIIELTSLFDDPAASSVYGRLTTKAATLYWALHEANNVLGLGLNLEPLVDFLKAQMESTSADGDFNQSVMQEIVEYVVQHSGEGESFYPFTNSRYREGYNKLNDNFFLLKSTTLDRILDGRRNRKSFLNDLVREGWIKSSESKVHYVAGTSSTTSGYEFDKNIIMEKLGIDMNQTSDKLKRQFSLPSVSITLTAREDAMSTKLRRKRR